MHKDVVIIIAEDDEGHASLIIRNLKRSGITNKIIWFKDGQEVLDFLFQKGEGPILQKDKSYLVQLDIRMPKIDGIEVLRQIKNHKELRKIPVVMVTTADNPAEIDECYKIGCNCYLTKPVDYNKFVAIIKQLGSYWSLAKFPQIDGERYSFV